ncbi:MAG: sterol desaturase family protein [Burkholderiales bacterium]|nr:sterol desaturase family protein [Burkholderiales bacterium]
MSMLGDAVGRLQTWLFEAAVQPALYALDLAFYAEPAYDALEWLIWGALEVAVLFAALRPLESLFPAERWESRREVGVDVLYTMLYRLGVVPLAFFFLLTPVVDAAEGWLRLAGFRTLNLEELFPPLASRPLAAFVVYLLVLDLADYWRHRLQHRFEWWWSLHALHHSQRRMSFWTDNRNHLLDDLIGSVWFAGIALAIGVSPGQFLLIVIATRMLESFSHANVRVWFGPVGERMLVSPRYHRRHHAIGYGHEGRYRGCNFAVLFPLWDILFRTADFSAGYPATGIRDQLAGARYGEGFWEQQWLGVKRLALSCMPARAN